MSFASIPPSTIKQPLLQLPMISCHQIQKTFFKSGLILLAFSRSFNTADFSPLKTLFLASYCAVVLPSLWSYLFCLALGFGPSPLLPYSLPNMVAAAVTSNMPITPKLIAQPFPPLWDPETHIKLPQRYLKFMMSKADLTHRPVHLSFPSVLYASEWHHHPSVP